jgi:hypothetical protein
MLEYYRADERPAWQATVTVNGVADNMSSGYTFQVKIHADGDPTTVLLTKTTNIVGAADGVVTINWVPNDLDLAPGFYGVQLKATRTSDNHEWTVADRILIRARA